MLKSVILIMLFFVLGCETLGKKVKRQADLNPAQYIGTNAKGSSSVRGQAFANLRNGNVKKASGAEVFLYPRRSHSIEWYETTVIKRQNLETIEKNRGDALAAFSKKALADADGHFVYQNLLEGCYVVATFFSWEIQSGLNQQARVGAEFCLKKGENKKIILKNGGVKY